MAGESKLVAIPCGLLTALSAVVPCGTSTQIPQQLPPPSYPPTADGFKAQFSGALEAYQQQHPADGGRLLQQFRLPRSAGWFGDQIRPELNEILAKRYERIFEQYVNKTENKLQDLAHANGRKLIIDLKPGKQDPPTIEQTPRPESKTPSGIVTVKQPVCFNAFFAVKFTSNVQTALTGDFRASAWLETFVYQDGAFRFVGSGAWPFWDWEDDYDNPSVPAPYVPTPLDSGAAVVDEVIPLEMDKVLAALKPAMANVGCEVKEATATSIECKRQRIYANSQHGGSGGESVTAGLEAKGAQTHVRISTGKGFYGRLIKQNWSVPIYSQMVKNLEQPPRDDTGS